MVSHAQYCVFFHFYYKKQFIIKEKHALSQIYIARNTFIQKAGMKLQYNLLWMPFNLKEH